MHFRLLAVGEGPLNRARGETATKRRSLSGAQAVKATLRCALLIAFSDILDTTVAQESKVGLSSSWLGLVTKSHRLPRAQRPPGGFPKAAKLRMLFHRCAEDGSCDLQL